MSTETSFRDNPPDYLALGAVFNVVANGCGYCGALATPTDEAASSFVYRVHAMGLSSDTTITRRAADVCRILEIPEADGGDQLQDKAAYGHIRSFSSPTDPPGTMAVTLNDARLLTYSISRELEILRNPISLKSHEKLEREAFENYEAPELALSGMAFAHVDLRKQQSFVLEWIDCLFSVLLSRRLFFPAHLKTDLKVIQDRIQKIKYKPDGSVLDPDPLVMCLVLSIGQAEWMALQGKAPIQATIKRMTLAKLGREFGS